MSRFFIENGLVKDSTISIQGSDTNHIKNVLRKSPGDELICFDASGTEYVTEIARMGKDKIELAIKSSKKLGTEPPFKTTLIQSLPKQSKMDDIVKNSTELGVFEIIPVTSERSIPRADRTERWRRIAKEAAEQSGRGHVPKIRDISPIGQALTEKRDGSLNMIAWEGEKSRTLKDVLRQDAKNTDIVVLIGPEGGFSAAEAKEAEAHGFIPVSLGKRIMRTETAGPAVLAMITYEREL